MRGDEQAIAELLRRYEEALNGSSEGALALYAEDAVFMAQNFPSSVGRAAMREAYAGIFGAITLKVRFAVAEVQQVSAEWAFGRTNSAGTVTVHATGAESAEANQELFVFRKVEGEWKIARYCFSTTDPARG